MKSCVMPLAILFAAISLTTVAVRAQATAPPGYHYEPGGMTPVPNDPCWLPALVSPGAVANVNRTLGKPQGVTLRVRSINDLASVEPNALAMLGIHLVGYDPEQGGIACNVTLHFVNASTQSGVLSIENPGEYAQLLVQWIPDTVIARDLARYDGLRSRKVLYVKPDLKTPSVQVCVGRAFVLGAQEQFPGQLWAACAQKNGSDLLPPNSREKHWPTSGQGI